MVMCVETDVCDGCGRDCVLIWEERERESRERERENKLCVDLERERIIKKPRLLNK